MYLFRARVSISLARSGAIIFASRNFSLASRQNSSRIRAFDWLVP